jgi:hypothetical protein
MNEQSFGGPYVQVAAICTTPLIEQGGLLSVIRIQDRIQLMGPTDRMQPVPLMNLWLLICLKSGEMRGQQQLTVTPNDPEGKALPSVSFATFFGGDEQGGVTAFPLNIVIEREGLYWFDVTMQQQLLTRIPLRVMYQKLQMMPGMVIPPSPHS